MEDLYPSRFDRQTIGSVVQELRATLSEAEKQIDQYFRDPTDHTPLANVPSELQSMKGVLAVLGLNLAAQAATACAKTSSICWWLGVGGPSSRRGCFRSTGDQRCFGLPD